MASVVLVMLMLMVMMRLFASVSVAMMRLFLFMAMAMMCFLFLIAVAMRRFLVLMAVAMMRFLVLMTMAVMRFLVLMAMAMAMMRFFFLMAMAVMLFFLWGGSGHRRRAIEVGHIMVMIFMGCIQNDIEITARNAGFLDAGDLHHETVRGDGIQRAFQRLRVCPEVNHRCDEHISADAGGSFKV